MTSASNPAAVLDAGRIGHSTLTAMIAELYTDLVTLPTHYTPHQRAAVITDAADATAAELITMLDDCIDREADRPPVTDYGWVMHADDRHHALTAALVTRTADHLSWWLTDQLNGFITDREDDDFD